MSGQGRPFKRVRPAKVARRGGRKLRELERALQVAQEQAEIALRAAAPKREKGDTA